jgi:predicted DNA-binding protein (MmcQ/YjbR family)
MALPGRTEPLSFGNPAFKAKGKAFAVLDEYRGKGCLWLHVDPGRRLELLASPGWCASPDDPREKALCRALSDIDWDLAATLIRDSHRHATARPKK